MRRRHRVIFIGVLGAVLLIGIGRGLSRWQYVPQEPLKISKHFIDLVEAGDLKEAYTLTSREALVGRTPAEFEANIRRQFGIEMLHSHHQLKLVHLGPYQSLGNHLRRWIMRRKPDPDEVIVDYYIGTGIPFTIKLKSNQKSEWQITFFESHAA